MTSDSFAKGLEGIIAAQSSICTVDGLAGRLIYRGIEIRELARHSTFEEVCYLLWFGKLPTREQLEDLKGRMAAERALPDEVISIIHRFPKASSPMHALRSVISALAMWDPEAEDMSPEANARKAIRLTAQTATIVAAHHRIRSGLEAIPPDRELGHAANFLYMLNGKVPDDDTARVLDVALILHADHELNASTFAGRVAASTLSDIYSAVTAAISALKGPLHGGANEEVMKMLLRIGSVDRVEAFVDAALAAHQKIPGFGHRVYKNWDPRALVLRDLAKKVETGTTGVRWTEVASRVAEVLLTERGFAEKKLFPNVDFYSGAVYYTMGIPVDLFTPVFAISRMSGWTAHILEQYADNRLMRPRADYVGPVDVSYVPIAERVAEKTPLSQA